MRILMTNKPHINHNCTQSEAPSCPLISVIIPTRNRSALLPRAIESVLGQTYENIELIIVDDASHDATPEVVDRYAARDPRVSFLRNPDNLGKSGALNAGIKKSRGDFLLFLDDDCEFFPHTIELYLSTFKSLPEKPCLLLTNSWIETIQGDTMFSLSLPGRYLTQKDFFSKQYSSGHPSAWFCRRPCVERLLGFDDQLKCWEDVDFFMRALINRHCLYFFNKPLLIIHMAQGISTLSPQYLKNKEAFLRKHADTLNRRRGWLSRFLYSFGKDYQRLGDAGSAKKYFRKAFAAAPWNMKYFIKAVFR